MNPKYKPNPHSGQGSQSTVISWHLSSRFPSHVHVQVSGVCDRSHQKGWKELEGVCAPEFALCLGFVLRRQVVIGQNRVAWRTAAAEARSRRAGNVSRWCPAGVAYARVALR